MALILTAAFIHAAWNLLAKRSGGGVAFAWLFTVFSALLYAPLVLALFVLRCPCIGGVELLFLCGSATLQLGYFLALQRGYQVGDLSLVYPLATAMVLGISALALG